jgi:hypothetical protein
MMFENYIGKYISVLDTKIKTQIPDCLGFTVAHIYSENIEDSILSDLKAIAISKGLKLYLKTADMPDKPNQLVVIFEKSWDHGTKYKIKKIYTNS